MDKLRTGKRKTALTDINKRLEVQRESVTHCASGWQPVNSRGKRTARLSLSPISPAGPSIGPTAPISDCDATNSSLSRPCTLSRWNGPKWTAGRPKTVITGRPDPAAKERCRASGRPVRRRRELLVPVLQQSLLHCGKRRRRLKSALLQTNKPANRDLVLPVLVLG